MIDIAPERVQKFRFDIEPMGAVRTTRRQMHKDQAAKRYALYKQRCQWVLKQALAGKMPEPTKAAIGIPKITFYMPLTKNAAKNGKKPGDYHTFRPDADNLVKGALDIFNGIYWYDDCQVCHIGEVTKVYGESPGIEIEVVELF